MKRFKTLTAIVLASFMAFQMVGCGGSADQTTDENASAEESADVENSEDKLVWATNAEFEPYEYRDGGEIVGIDAEIADEIASRLGLEAEVADMNFDSIIPAVTSGKADIGIAGMTVTEDRLQNVNFSTPYINAGQAIIVPEDSDITGEDDLVGLTIGVQLGTTGDLYVTDNIADTTVERYTKGFEAVQALLQGKIDAVVIDGEPAKAFVKLNEGIKMCDDYLTVEEYAIAVSKDNEELLDQINSALADMEEDGTLTAIFDKYLGDGEDTDEAADSDEAAEETTAE